MIIFINQTPNPYHSHPMLPYKPVSNRLQNHHLISESFSLLYKLNEYEMQSLRLEQQRYGCVLYQMRKPASR
jgi:hypothetical protein